MMSFAAVRNSFIALIVVLGVADFFIAVHWVGYALPVVAFVLYIVAGSTTMSYNIFLSAYTSPSGMADKIAITFDDGPVPGTEKVLDILKKYNAKASFFCIGKRIEAHRPVAERIHAEGHFIGNHSYDHHAFFPLLGKRRIADEIEVTNILIKEVTGRENNYFRPPYGVTNPAIAGAVKATAMKVIGWNIRSFDTMGKSPEKVISRVISRLKPGAVVLLHDHRKDTADILEAILQYAGKQHYQCVRIDEIF